MLEDPITTAIDALLNGSATAADEALVRQWIAENPERQTLLTALKADVQATAGLTWDTDAAWVRIATSTPDVGRTKKILRPATAWRLAAGFILLLGAGVLLRRDAATSKLVANTMREVNSGAGQRLLVNLADGSRVTLNAGTRLTYDSSASGARDVTLDGEAYFEVQHDVRRPFRVHTARGVAEDVGTRFVVRAFGDQANMLVAVDEGAVRIQHPADTSGAKLILAGMVGKVGDGASPTAAQIDRRDRYFAWTRGLLAMDGQTLHAVVPMLERWYGVRIKVSPTLGERRVFGTFGRETVSEALGAIALALDADMSEAGHTITLTPRRK